MLCASYKCSRVLVLYWSGRQTSQSNKDFERRGQKNDRIVPYCFAWFCNRKQAFEGTSPIHIYGYTYSHIYKVGCLETIQVWYYTPYCPPFNLKDDFEKHSSNIQNIPNMMDDEPFSARLPASNSSSSGQALCKAYQPFICSIFGIIANMYWLPHAYVYNIFYACTYTPCRYILTLECETRYQSLPGWHYISLAWGARAEPNPKDSQSVPSYETTSRASDQNSGFWKTIVSF